MITKKVKTTRDIGSMVKKRRKELGMSQEELAEVLNVTYQQVQRYENGKNRLNVENIQIIADALSVPVTFFFKPEKAQSGGEDRAFTLPPDETKLLKYFRRVKNKKFRQTLIQVARIAAKVE